MKRSLLFFALAAMFAIPSFAQHRNFDLTPFVTWVDISGDSVVQGPPSTTDEFRVRFKSDIGYGVNANIFWGDHLSTEFGAAVVKPRLSSDPSNSSIPASAVGDLQMIPITGTLQWHFSPNGFIDPYIGGGVAYVLFDDVDNGRDLSNTDLNKINFKDDMGFVVNAGLGIRLSNSLGINLDGKYVPVHSKATAEFASGPAQGQKIDVNPLMLSAGLRWSF